MIEENYIIDEFNQEETSSDTDEFHENIYRQFIFAVSRH